MRVDDLGAAIEAVATGDIEHLRAIYPRPMAVIGDITRATICASPGHQLLSSTGVSYDRWIELSNSAGNVGPSVDHNGRRRGALAPD
jgi:hypothetical protein